MCTCVRIFVQQARFGGTETVSPENSKVENCVILVVLRL